MPTLAGCLWEIQRDGILGLRHRPSATSIPVTNELSVLRSFLFIKAASGPELRGGCGLLISDLVSSVRYFKPGDRSERKVTGLHISGGLLKQGSSLWLMALWGNQQ